MPARRLVDFLHLLRESESEAPGQLRLCDVTAAFTGLGGVGIGLASPPLRFEILCASSDTVSRLLHHEWNAGDGPCTEVCRTDVTVSEPHLASGGSARWTDYVATAIREDVGAVFGFPVRFGVIRLGALVAFNAKPGELSAEQLSDCHLAASIIARSILSTQAGAPPGELAAEIEQSVSFDPIVHQAAGMLSVQAGLAIGDALVLLRAHAYAIGVEPHTLALQLVERAVAYDATRGAWSDDR